ncbi:MAG: hypothetical protein ACK504_12655 [Bacteroidota bacterium]
MTKYILFISITTCSALIFLSCKKDKLLTDPNAEVSFSQTSILFDTVFTSVGSTTQQIKVRNRNKQKINISSIRLQSGNSSMFTLNVDGVSTKATSDVEILAEDSIYIFVQVNVNPSNANSPFVIKDKILFDVNGNQQSITLEAWGQNAYYHYPDKAIQYKNGYLSYSTISDLKNTTVNWANDKPHVIYGWLVVDSTQTLIIDPGVKIHFHQNAGLWVYRYGTLQVNGKSGKEVVFQSDQIEQKFPDYPGQWDRIWINEGSTDNYINYAIIKNGFIGIQAEVTNSLAAPKRLRLTNTIINNCAKYCLFSVAFNIWGSNNIISNCKESCARFTLGGNYTFLHTTFANNYFNGNFDIRTFLKPCLHIDNYLGRDYFPLDSANFTNCIIDGSFNNELELDIKTESTFTKNYKFSNCLIKAPDFSGVNAVNNVFNKFPYFNLAMIGDYRIKDYRSAARNIGDPSVLTNYPYVFVQTDIRGAIRSTTIDAGAYQYIP